MQTPKADDVPPRRRVEEDVQRLDSLRLFLRRNAQTLDAVESVVQAATWLLPDDNNTELLLEGLSALMGVLSVIRDTDPSTSGRGSSVPLLRVPPQVLIAVIQRMEVLAEVAAKRFFGEELKWSLLALVEGAKAWGRLHTLFATGGGILIEGSTPSARVMLARGASASEAARMQQLLRALASFRSARAPEAAPIVPPPAESSGRDPLQLVVRYILTGTTAPGEPFLPPSEAIAAAGQCAWEVAQRAGAIVHEAAQAISRGPRDGREGERAQAGMLYAGESLHILRPLLYCLVRRRYGSRSWRPLSAALAADLLSRALLTRAIASAAPGTAPGTGASSSAVSVSEEEREELRRRKLYLLYYLLYSPAYEAGLQAGMRRVQRRVDGVPGLGVLSRRAVELIDSIQGYHTYVTTS